MSLIEMAGRSRAGPGAAGTRPGVSDSAADAPVGGADAVHLLVFNDPDAPVEQYGLGWTLVTCGDRGPWRWRSLAGCGADADAGHAQAAAAEVLIARGVSVRGWYTGDGPARRMYRADCARDDPAAAVDAVGGMPRVTEVAAPS